MNLAWLLESREGRKLQYDTDSKTIYRDFVKRFIFNTYFQVFLFREFNSILLNLIPS